MSRFPMQTSMIIALMLVSLFAKAGGIYHCVDKFGSFNFSDKPCPNAGKKGGDNETQEVWKALKELVKEGRIMASNQQSNVDSILACKSIQKDLISRLEALRTRVDGVGTRNEDLLSVYDQMTQCIECKASAPYNCSRIDTKLDSAMNQIDMRR